MTYFLCALLLAAAGEPKTDDEKSLYAIGYLMGSRNLSSFNLKPEEMKFVERGMNDGALGKKAALDVDKQMDAVNKFAQKKSGAQADKPSIASRSCARARPRSS